MIVADRSAIRTVREATVKKSALVPKLRFGTPIPEAPLRDSAKSAAILGEFAKRSFEDMGSQAELGNQKRCHGL